MEIRITKEFKSAFEMCMEHWNVTSDELDFEKQRVRANYQDAERCYLSIASQLKGAMQ